MLDPYGIKDPKMTPDQVAHTVHFVVTFPGSDGAFESSFSLHLFARSLIQLLFGIDDGCPTSILLLNQYTP
jgi:hypothetical protein